jgi:hypothetical protein
LLLIGPLLYILEPLDIRTELDFLACAVNSKT